MKSIGIDWVREWAASVQIDLKVTLDASYLGLRSPKHVVISTEHREPSDLILLANRTVCLGLPDVEEQSVASSDGYLFWIRATGVWNEIQEGIATEAFRALMRGYGQEEEQTLFLSDAEGREALKVLALHMIIFGWDSCFAPLSGSFLCHISHDGYVELSSSNALVESHLSESLSAWIVEEHTDKT